MALINGQEISPQLLDALLRGDNPSLSGPSQQDLIAAIMSGQFGDQTSRWAEQAANPYWGFGGRPGNLTPEQLAGLKQGIVPEGYSIGVGGYETRGDQGIDSAQDPYYVLYQGMEDPTWGTGKWNTWDLNGNYLGYGSADSELRGLVKAAAIAAAMYGGAAYGANAMGGEAAAGGGAGGAAGGGGAAAGGSSITLPTTAEMAAGMTPASASTAAGAMPAVNIAASGATGAGAGAAAGGGSGGTAGSSGVNSMRAGEIAGYSTNGTMPSSAATVGGNMTAMDQLAVALNGTTGTEGLIGSGGNMAGTGGGSTAGLNSGGALGSLFGGNGNTLGGLLGAYLGYQDSKDKENTSKTEPWGPAQPYLKGLLGEGASLYDQYKQQPFSPAEQTAYSNYGNTLDFINANAPGLMSGFDATARGANQFSRNNPRRGLIGNSYDAATSPVAWNPGLLGSFGTRKG